MYKSKVFVSVFLSFLLVFNPFFLNVLTAQQAVADSTAQTAQAEQETNQAYQQLAGTSSIGTKWYMSSGTKNQIKDANKALGEAKTEVGSAKDSVGQAKGNFNDAVSNVKSVSSTLKGDGNFFDKFTAVAAGIQKTLICIGNMLKNIGNALQSIGKALQILGRALQSNPFTASIGSALVTVGEVLQKVGVMLFTVGTTIFNIGEKASFADMGFGELLGSVFDAGKSGWFEGAAVVNNFKESLDKGGSVIDTAKSIGDAVTGLKNVGEKTKDKITNIISDVEQKGLIDF